MYMYTSITVYSGFMIPYKAAQQVGSTCLSNMPLCSCNQRHRKFRVVLI